MVPPASPRYLLDTNILLAYMRAGDLGQWIEATYHLRSAPTVPLISVVTQGEIRSLSLQRGWGQAKVRRLGVLIGCFVSIELEFGGVIDAYATIDHESRRLGRSMGKNDVWIAATAHATGTRLLTTDKDFDHLHPSFLTRDLIDPANHP